MATAEFVLSKTRSSDRRTPLRWILSHVSRQRWLVIIALIGAIGNAALAAVVPVLVGMAFNNILADPPDISQLGRIALLSVGSQI